MQTGRMMLRNFGGHDIPQLTLRDAVRLDMHLGLQRRDWGTGGHANTWLGEEGLFEDLKKIAAPTLILHGLDDKVCLFPLAQAQHESIKNSKLVPFESCGHFLFYDQMERFTKELAQFAGDM
jgi:non-heme chloroperoxidase